MRILKPAFGISVSDEAHTGNELRTGPVPTAKTTVSPGAPNAIAAGPRDPLEAAARCGLRTRVEEEDTKMIERRVEVVGRGITLGRLDTVKRGVRRGVVVRREGIGLIRA